MHDDHKTKDEPSEKLEKKAAKHPDNEDIQVDLGSDESMDASDPVSAAQPGGGKHEKLPHKGDNKNRGQ